LQKLEELYGGPEGPLFIMAFPCNNFGRQEPKENAEIAEFAKRKGATFNMMEKVECDNGAKTHPLYAGLINSSVGKGESLGWNFAKFLCNEKGEPVKRYSSGVKPMDIERDIKNLL
jgi:glutathione peroxidase